MTREEALQTIKEKMHYYESDKQLRDAIKTLIPKLKKSEDERIIDALILELKTNPCIARTNGYNRNSYITWLEKQKEQKLNFDTHWENGSMVCEQKEQKPVVTHGETYHVDTLGTQQVIAGKMPQKTTEWSKEDEKMLDMLISRLNWITHNTRTDGTSPNITFFDEIAWLKSLPLNLKKKNEDVAKLCSNEWSKEDEKDAAHIIRILDDCYAYGRHDLSKTDHENLVNKLKSLHPQPHTVSIKDATKFGNLEYERGVKDGIQSEKSRHWKPSEEQLEAFRSYIKDFQEKAEAAVGGWNNFDVMIQLFEQLKKL